MQLGGVGIILFFPVFFFLAYVAMMFAGNLDSITRKIRFKVFGYREVIYVTPHYFIVIKNRAVMYMSIVDLRVTNVEPIREYGHHGVEINSFRVRLQNLHRIAEVEVTSPPTILSAHVEVFRKAEMKGMLETQDDLALS